MKRPEVTRPSWGILGTLLTVAVLGVVFYLKAQQNYLHQDPINKNFFSFWLSGRMVWTGQSPYDQAQWLGAFDAFGATYRPSQILQYPLPLMFFMAPLGLLSPGPAYFAWQLACEVILAVSIYILLRRQRGGRLLFVPIVLFLLFFGPTYLSLEIGSIGALALLAITLAILLFENDKPLWAGVALSVTLLKPPQALTLLFLMGFWLLVGRQWKAIAGILLGGLALLIVWVLRDPLWLVKFRGSSGFLLGHTLGIQSNVFGFAYWACDRSVTCMGWLGSAGMIVVLAAGAVYLWRNRGRLTAWQALNVIIPLGFISALYLYSYDQLLYVIPIVWIVARLLERTHSYLPVFAFLILIDIVSFAALVLQATTHLDLWSVLTTIVVLAVCLWLLHERGPAFSPGRLTAPDSPVQPD